jgi:hypothetical protein
MPECLAFPDKDPSPRQDEQPNGTNDVKDIWNAYRSNPSWHSEDEDRAEQVTQEGKCGERISNNLCK